MKRLDYIVSVQLFNSRALNPLDPSIFSAAGIEW